MTGKYKLSLHSAILISINIILGAGLFLNTVPLAQKAGALSPFIYLIVAALMIPLILVITHLVEVIPGGSLYTFAKKGLSMRWGFLVGWSYFVAKLASCSVMIHLFTSMARQAFPSLECTPQVFLDLTILLVFTLLNLMNMRTGNRIQMVFIMMKTIPISFIILAGLAKCNLTNFTAANVSWTNTMLAIPLVLYAFTGFESIIALSSHLKDPEKNGPISIFGAFFIAAIITFLLQGSFYSVVNIQDIYQTQSFNGITAFIKAALPSWLQTPLVFSIFQLAVGISALGGAYGILFSNNWNLYALAEANLLPWSAKLAIKNQYNIPVVCITIQSIICCLYLTLAGSKQIMLQQINALGCTFAYTISTLAYLALSTSNRDRTVGTLALLYCFFFIASCIWGFVANGVTGLVGFLSLVSIGVIAHLAHTLLQPKPEELDSTN